MSNIDCCFDSRMGESRFARQALDVIVVAMLIGHFSVELAAGRLAPRTSLGLLVIAAEFRRPDLADFLLLGIELFD